MKKYIIFLLLLLLFSSPVIADNTLKNGTFITIDGGLGFRGNQTFNNRLRADDFPALNNLSLGYNIGIQSNFNRLIIKGSLQNFQKQEALFNNNYVSLNVDHKTIDLGLSLLNPFPNLRIFPVIGFGVTNAELSLQKNDGNDIKAVTPTPPENEIVLTKKGTIINLGLGTDYLINVSGEDMDKTALQISLRLGYRLGIENNFWVSGDEMYQGLDLSLGGFYFYLSFGGGMVEW